MEDQNVEIYTDGSCHTQRGIGTWVALIFNGTNKKVLSGTMNDTTHNQMELIAVINAIEYAKLHNQNITSIRVYTDSQYVVMIPERKKKMELADFNTKNGSALPNADLVKKILDLLSWVPVEFIKIVAHQKKTDTNNYNREADMLSRKLLRKVIRETLT
jgi:ribonuclease HI